VLIMQSPVPFPLIFAPGLDVRAATFTIAVSLICAVVVGTAPWWQIRIADLSARLKESSRGSDGPGSQRLRNSLVVAEVALAIVLLVGASLMIQSVRKVAAIDPGFDPESLLTVHISLPRGPAPPAPLVSGRKLLERLGAISGVSSASLGNDLPLDATPARFRSHQTVRARSPPRTGREPTCTAYRQASSRHCAFHS